MTMPSMPLLHANLELLTALHEQAIAENWKSEMQRIRLMGIFKDFQYFEMMKDRYERKQPVDDLCIEPNHSYIRLAPLGKLAVNNEDRFAVAVRRYDSWTEGLQHVEVRDNRFELHRTAVPAHVGQRVLDAYGILL